MPLDPPDPPVNAEACSQLMAQLPETVDGQSPRDTDPSSGLTAAYGDPAITVRCGVPDPAALTPAAQLFTVNNVDWFPEQQPDGYVFTTYRRQTNVEVTVPDDYSPEAEALTALSDVVKETVAPRAEN
ncbi:MAG: DUF3515 domain-containing protein [Actinomycetes bacterium]